MFLDALKYCDFDYEHKIANSSLKSLVGALGTHLTVLRTNSFESTLYNGIYDLICPIVILVGTFIKTTKITDTVDIYIYNLLIKDPIYSVYVDLDGTHMYRQNIQLHPNKTMLTPIASALSNRLNYIDQKLSSIKHTEWIDKVFMIFLNKLQFLANDLTSKFKEAIRQAKESHIMTVYNIPKIYIIDNQQIVYVSTTRGLIAMPIYYKNSLSNLCKTYIR